MLRSMTAFARSEQQNAGWMMTWELRSLNHRFLEITIRLPEALRFLEPEVRERINRTLNRGKVECTLKLQSATATQADIALNRPLVERLLALAAELEHMLGPGTGLRLSDVLNWPGVISTTEPDLEEFKTSAFEGLDQALADLVATREREGQRTAEMILQRCEAMLGQIRHVRARRPEIMVRLREKWLARLAEIPVEPDHNRLEQELAIIAQRLDVDEELDRLDAHLAEISQVLKRPEAVGRRLDFLTQELNREANTLSAKSADTETTRAAVELKVLIEQIREQVQNIE